MNRIQIKNPKMAPFIISQRQKLKIKGLNSKSFFLFLAQFIFQINNVSKGGNGFSQNIILNYKQIIYFEIIF